MKNIRLSIVLFTFALVAGLYLWFEYTATTPDTQQAGSPRSVTEILGNVEVDQSGFARAERMRQFSFPVDHGPHPEFKHEWWYFTGNVEDKNGRHFGYQLTFFRIALSPTALERESFWAMNQMFMAHFALSDVSGTHFYGFERFSRGAAGLAAAKASPFRVWLEDWSVHSINNMATFPLRLQANQEQIAIDLTLAQGKPIVLQGEQGLSQKSAAPGNASYYYSLTRMPTRGTIVINNESYTVDGQSWLDREWSTSALGEEQVGWDWFALQLSNSEELMFYQLRNKDGSIDPYSRGTLLLQNGVSRSLLSKDVNITVLDHWTSRRSEIRYPSQWRLQIPSEGLELEITPYLLDQELNVSVSYWEGAVSVKGKAHGNDITGQGYVELVGYQ